MDSANIGTDPLLANFFKNLQVGQQILVVNTYPVSGYTFDEAGGTTRIAVDNDGNFSYRVVAFPDYTPVPNIPQQIWLYVPPRGVKMIGRFVVKSLKYKETEADEEGKWLGE